MNDLSALASLGLELPGPGYIFGAIVFGLIGWVVFRRARKAANRLGIGLGLALMLYPYAVSQTWLLYVVGALLSGAAWWYRDR